MVKRNIVLAVLMMVAGGVLVATQGYSGPASKDDMCVPMGVITLKAPDGVETKRAEVDFPHARHFDVSCVTCHHTWDRTEPIVGCMTSGCHDLEEIPKRKPGEKVDEEAVMAYYKTAFHKSCISCHKEMKAKNAALQKSTKTLKTPLPKTGPTTCNGCHPKD